MENPNGKKTLGRRKIPMRKIEKKSSLQVAFTKRRGGLFRKASELSILCRANVAIMVQSPAEKLYAFGNPSVVASLVNRIDPSPEAARFAQGYEAAMKMLETEKGGFWWEKPSEGFELHELEGFRTALGEFREKVTKKLDGFEKPSTVTQQHQSSNLIPAHDQDFNFSAYDQGFGFPTYDHQDFGF
ncbi:MADS-box transcription factor 23-like [Salvia divinorum]|uniref:MADS-box transcription factor 23-like n=1 Tax=Salvia divinorum TaxID=28513 RepID=A0ABD1HVN7_SALDI